MGVIVETYPGEDGLVRTVEVRLASRSILKRPIHKLVLLLESSGKVEQDPRTIGDDSSSRAEC